MTGIRTTRFRGMAPKINRRSLPDNFAQVATNCKIEDGGLIPYLQTTLSADLTLAGGIKTMWRYLKDDQKNWLVWNKEVHAVGSPISQDSFGRVYWTGDGEPRMTSYAAAISSPPYPSAFFVLGVEPPKADLTVSSVTGGSAPVVSRAYVHTLVTQYGEESGPSAAVIQSGNSTGATWNLGSFGSLPSNTWTVTGITLSGTEATVTVSGDLYGTYQHETVTIASATGVTGVNATWKISEIVSSTVFKFPTTLTGTVTGSPTATRVAAHNTASMTRRIYRSESSGAFLFVAEQAAATGTFADNISSTALGETLNEDIRTPPKNGFGLIALPNGSHAMLAGNELCLSEPFRPHSYPTANRYARSERGIALVASQNNVIILTDSNPIIAVATQSDAVSFAVMADYAPCVSSRGVTPAAGGAVFPSYDGLWLVTPSQAVKLTENIYEVDQWQKLKPETFAAAVHDQTYFAQYTPDEGAPEILVFDLLARDSVVQVSYQSTAIYSSPLDQRMYIAKDENIYEWDSDESNPMTMFWLGKEQQMLRPINLAVGQVYAEYDQIVPVDTSILDANIALMADSDAVWWAGAGLLPGDGILGFGIEEVPTSTAGTVIFQIYDDQDLKFSKNLSADRSFKLPKGYKSDKLALAVSATIPVFDLVAGETINDLKQV